MTSEDIGELIANAGLGTESWDTVVSAMIDMLPGTFGGIHSIDRRTGICNFNAIAGVPHEKAASYMDYYSTVNPWRPLLDRWPTGRMMSTARCAPVENFTRTEFVNDWLAPMQANSIAVGVKLDAMGDDLINLHIHLPGHRGDGLEHAVDDLIRSHIGTLRRALHMNRFLAGRASRSIAAAALVARNTSIAFVVDGNFMPVDANSAADIAFAGPGPLLYRASCVRFVHDAAQQWYSQAVLSLLAREPTAQSVYHFRDDTGHWRITLALVPEFDPRAGNRWIMQRKLVLVLVDDLRPQPTDAALSEALAMFALTPAEIRLCGLLATGVTLGEAAERIGIQRETARHRLKSIFAKTGTRRQVDLVVLLDRLGRRP